MLLGVPRVVRLTDQAINPEPTDEMRIHVLTTCEQLGAHIKVRVYNTGSVQHRHAHVEWRRVTVVDTETVECSRELFDVFRHMGPEPWVI